MARIEPNPVAEAVEADVAAIPLRDDLPVGHWLYCRRAARAVWSGETDKVVDVKGGLCAVATVEALCIAVGEPVPEPVEPKLEPVPEPVEPKPEPIDVVRVR